MFDSPPRGQRIGRPKMSDTGEAGNMDESEIEGRVATLEQAVAELREAVTALATALDERAARPS